MSSVQFLFFRGDSKILKKRQDRTLLQFSKMDQLQSLSETPTSLNMSIDILHSSNRITSPWYWISATLIEILILLANGVLALIIIKSSRLHQSANWFILSLAVSDLFFGVVVIPSSMLCNVWLSCNNDVRWVLADLVVYVSIANVCVMSLDRLAAVEFPMKYQVMVVPRVKRWIILSWVVPTIVSAVPFCWMFAESGATIVQINKIFRAVQLLVFELVPCAIMILVHGRIFVIRRRHSRQISLQRIHLSVSSTNSNNDRSERPSYRAKKFLGVTATLVIFYVSCWFFSAVSTLCRHFEICEVSQAGFFASSLLWYLNPVINGLICLFMKTDIRNELWRFLRTLLNTFLC